MHRVPFALLFACACCSKAQVDVPDQDPANQPPRSVIVAGYDLGLPTRSFLLPDDLQEISAIAAADDHTLACVQDEKGALFFFDLDQGRLVRRAKFGPGGDYEGLAKIGDDYWVLRSDGVVLRLVAAADRYEIAETLATGLPVKEFEGLAVDGAANRFVLAPKSVAKETEERDLRPLFAFDLATRVAAKEPLITLHLDEVLDAARLQGIAVPTRISKRGKEKPLVRLFFAEVAVHPETGDLWLLSAGDRALLVVDRNGKLRGMHFFTTEEMPQPEAATFLPNGNLVLGSEGAGGRAVLRVYARVPQLR
jgi:uncharacterized protein YjiK